MAPFNLKDLELSDPRTNYGLLAASSDNTTAMVSKGLATVFVSGINTKNKNDVMDSTLLAQLAASHLYDPKTQTDSWYNEYTHVLENIGWDVSSFKFDQHELSGSSVSASSVVLECMQAYLEPFQLSLLSQLIEALQKTGDPVASIFSSASSYDNQAQFQLGMCQQDAHKNVSFSVGAFSYTCSEHVTNCLVMQIKSSSAKFFNSFQSMVLNGDIYEDLRETVRKKLGKNGQDFIGNLVLPKV